VQRQVYGLPAPEVRKVAWGYDTTLPTSIDAAYYFRINALHDMPA